MPIFFCFSAYISIYFGHILILLHAFATLISFLQETKFFPCHSDWALGIISAPVRYKEISGPVWAHGNIYDETRSHNNKRSMTVQRAKFSTNWTSPAHIMSSCNQPVTMNKTFPFGWTTSVEDEDKPTKRLQRKGQNMLPRTIIQEPLEVLFLRINFQQRECLNDKFQRRIFRYKIFLLFFQQKNVSSVFLSLALDLCRPFYRWASLACRLLSLFLRLPPALYSNFVDITS